MRLLNFNITRADSHLTWQDREWMGPEYRDIIMLFRAGEGVRFKQREPVGVSGNKKLQGYVKHYGKAISIESWESTCDYYIKYFPRYAKKWIARKGKAIHFISDFGRPLIRWDDRKDSNKIGPRMR